MLHIVKNFTHALLLAILICSQVFVYQLSHASSMFEAMSVAEERKLGEQVDLMMKTKAPLIFDPYALGYLQRMVDRISKNIVAQPFELEVNLLRDTRLNAFATAGGFLYVHTGLLLAMENESELAGVVGHEIAHITQRHIAKRQQTSTLAMLTSLVAAAAMAVAASQGSGSDVAAGAITGGIAAGQSMMLNYSRQDENEADTVGYEYLVKAGYDPNGFVSAFRKLQAQSYGAKGIPTYLSSHPDLLDRIVIIEGRIRAEGSKLKVAKQDNTEFLAVQTFLRSQIDSIANAKHHLAKMNQELPITQLGLAIVAARQQDKTNAEKHYKKALAKEANNPLILREYGFFHYELGDIYTALTSLQKSAKIDSRDLMTKFYLARVLDASNQSKEAQRNFKKILEEYPYDAEVHKYLGYSYGKSGDKFQGYLHLAYSSLFYYNNRDADKKFKQAEKIAKSDAEKKALEKYTKTKNYFKEMSEK